MKPRLNCNSGFSLVEMLVGASILTLVAFSSAFLVGETRRTENSGEALYQLNQTHLLAMQKSKSIADLKAAIGLTSGSMLSNCFSGRGTGCNSYATASWNLIPGSVITSTEVGQRKIASNSHYRIECGHATSCGSVVIRVQSSLFQGSTRLSSRDSEVRLSGVFLGDRQKLDFSCTATGGHFLTALDMTGLRGECLPLPSTPPCASPLPLTKYLVAATPSCQPAVSLACANGLRTVGILERPRGLHVRNGFALVEALIASGIVVLAALGMGTAFQQMGRTQSKVRSVSAALSVESALQAKLQDKNTYAAIASRLASGSVTSLNSLSVPLEIPFENTTRTANLTVGQDLYFDPDINPCTGCVTADDWMLRVRVEAQKRPGAAFPVYVMAYRIDFNSHLANMTAIGSQNPSGFATTDYKWAVPPEAYINSTLVPCDPTNKEIFITGMNKVTGRANCMRLDDTVSCGVSEVADGWRVVSGNLQIHCKPLQTASITAPPYVVQNFNPYSADSAISGTAVVVTDSPWPLKTASGFTVPYTGRSVAGMVCPPNYRFVGTCGVVGSTSWPGYRDIGCPSGQTGGPVWTTVPATGVGAVTDSSSGNSVNCALFNPIQPTGSGYDAGWDANIQVTGSCVLIPPETVPL